MQAVGVVVVNVGVLMCQRRLVIGTLLSLTLALAAKPIRAQQPLRAGVRVSSDGANITLRTTQNGPLSDILREFCNHTSTVCEGMDGTAGMKLPPVIVIGTWEQVVAKLMEGTGLNYVAILPTVTTGGRLLVTGHALSLDASPQTATASGGASCLPQAVSGLGGQVPSDCASSLNLGLGSQNPSSAPDGAFSTPQPPTDVAASGGAMPSFASPSRPTAGPGQGDDAMQPIAEYSLPAALPFPDSSGHPIPLSDEPPTFLPFPDSHGSPIPISAGPNLPQYLPFPDGHGNPMPVSELPAQYLPFPDSKGNPMPVQPGIPQ